MKGLIKSDNQGNWQLNGVDWKQLQEGSQLTADESQRIYGALAKLHDYEKSGLSPSEVIDFTQRYGSGSEGVEV